MRHAGLAVLCLLVAAGVARAEESPLLGKPLPELALSHAVQGPTWDQERLKGSVVVLELFQLGCPACMSNSMPHAETLYQRFAADDRVRVVAVATAFEKEQYPWMADEAKIKAELVARKWSFPVMRDADEKTVKLLALRSASGTPMTLVLDAEGVVRWHGFNGSAETASEVEKAVNRLLDWFYVAPIDALAPRLKPYAVGAYGSAHATAKALLDASDTPAEMRTQAAQVLTNLDAGVARLLADSDAKRAHGYPSLALQRVDTVLKVFLGVPKSADAAARAKAWKVEPAFQKELKAEKELESALAALQKPAPKRDVVVKRLRTALTTYAGTPVTVRIESALASLE